MSRPTEPASADERLKLSNQLCFATYAAAHAFGRVYKPMLDRLGLTYPQYLVLLVLWEQDGLMVKEVGARLHLDSGTVTPILKRLEAAGLLRRERDRADERQVRISLTERGRSLKGEAADVNAGVACAVGMGADELGELKERIARLRETLDGFAGEPA